MFRRVCAALVALLAVASVGTASADGAVARKLLGGQEDCDYYW
jgi:hypothetical protein